MIIKSFILIILLYISSHSSLCALNMESHFYAYGQNDSINVFWDYIGDDDVLGCNLLRSDEPNGQFAQINNELIIPIENEFHYTDIDSVIDTVNYYYKIDYVFVDSIFYYNTIYGSFKEISLNVLDENSIEFVIDTRAPYSHEFRWYIDDAVYYCIPFCDSLTLILDLDQLELIGDDYLFQFINLENQSSVTCHLTLDYLYNLINNSNSNEILISSKSIHLNQNYPNPFNPSTTIEFLIHNDSHIELFIYNIKGQRIKTLAHNEFTKGSHSIVWIGDDKYNKPVSSGVYLYKLNVNGKIEAVKKCLFLK